MGGLAGSSEGPRHAGQERCVPGHTVSRAVLCMYIVVSRCM